MPIQQRVSALLLCVAFLLPFRAFCISEVKRHDWRPGQDFQTDVDFTSNYVFRGISQSDNEPAVQASMTYTLPKTGIYGYVWSSNVNFPDTRGKTVRYEGTGGVGYAHHVDSFYYDLSYVRYQYPGTEGTSYNEFLADLQFHYLTFLVGYSANVYDTGQSGTYYNVGIHYEIPEKYALHMKQVNLIAGFGRYLLPVSAGLNSYNDYQIQLTKKISRFQLSLGWSNTNGRSVDKPSLSGNFIVFTALASY